MVLKLADDFMLGFWGTESCLTTDIQQQLQIPLKPNEMDVRIDPVTVATFSDHPYCEYLAHTDMSGTKTWACSLYFGSSAFFMQCNAISHCERHIL